MHAESSPLKTSIVVLAKLTNFGSSVFAFGYTVTGRTDTATELQHLPRLISLIQL
jgi:hypothetical protein